MDQPDLDRSHNILVWPAEWSHWLNMKKIVDYAHDKRGHKITVIRPGLYTDFIKNSTKYDIIDLKTPGYEPSFHIDHLRHILSVFKIGDRSYTVIEKMTSMVKFWMTHITQRHQTCDMLFKDKKILAQLKKSDFNVVIADPCVICGEMLAAYLDIPLIHNVRMLPGDVHQSIAGAPLPASYVPLINTEFTDKMNFIQRLVNYCNLVVQQLATKVGTIFFADDLIQAHLVGNPESLGHVTKGTSIYDLQSRAAVWLIRLDFTFEFPRPLMPNMKYIGGFNAMPANLSNIPDKISDFLDSAENGVIVLSMGSMVDQMGMRKASIIAKALNEIERGYKVIWRYKLTPENKSFLDEVLDQDKVLVLPWLPQNDLLGHPKVCLFMTHGGTNGLYEAIYHSVPVLGLPLLVDQFDNLVRIERWDAGSHFDITNLKTVEDSYLLSDKVNSVLLDDNITKNMKKFSNIHKYRLNNPLDEITFWIEYVINTNGAQHFYSMANELNFFQYHLLDVYAFILTMIAVVIYSGYLLKTSKRSSKSVFRTLMHRRSDSNSSVTSNSSTTSESTSDGGTKRYRRKTKSYNKSKHARFYYDGATSLRKRSSAL